MKFDRFLPLYLFLFALLIRLTFLAITYPGKEEVQYHEDVKIALNLLEGEGYAFHYSRMFPHFDKQVAALVQQGIYHFPIIPPQHQTRPTAAKPPVYPLLVALVFASFGIKNFFALFVVHALLAAFTCSLLFVAIAKYAYNTAIIAGLAFALYPPFIHHSISTPESTTMIMFLISLLCYELVRLHERFSQGRWVLAFISSGFLALTEPITMPFIAFSILYIAYVIFSSWKEIFTQIIIGVFIFATVIAPWTIRNYLVFKQFVFLKSNFGGSLKENMNVSGIQLSEGITLDLLRRIEGVDEVSEDRAVKTAMVAWIAEHPKIYLRLLLKNFSNFWWETPNYKIDWTVKYIFGRKIPYIFLLICSTPAILWRIIQLLKSPRLSARINIYHNMMLILIFTYTVIHTIVGAFLLRYHFPVELGMFVFGADTIIYITHKGQLSCNNSLLPLRLSLRS